jgi:CRISPR-associated protein Csd1
MGERGGAAMILQALYEYYYRSQKSPPEGFEKRYIPFVISIGQDGSFLDLEDTSERAGKVKSVKEFFVPKDRHTTGSNAWAMANVFWDHYGFVLGHPKDETEKAKQLASKQRVSFRDLVKLALTKYPESAVARAVSLFYEKEEWRKVFLHETWGKCASIKGTNLTFRIDGIGIATDTQDVREFAACLESSGLHKGEEERALDCTGVICLVTGEVAPIARKHSSTPIKGSRSNAKIVSFQKHSGYDSYGKTQGSNAPVSSKAEFAYTAALKTLLSRDSSNKMTIGIDTVLFWSEKDRDYNPYDLEKDFSWFFAEPPADDPDSGIRAVKALYEAVYSGALPADGGSRFYVLGLAPNAARIAVRFWRVGTITEFAVKIKRHFDDFEIVHSAKDREYLPLNEILRATALDYKIDNVPPNLAGAVIESILDGTPYPITLMQQCMRRIRAERRVTRDRAAILKAYINRFKSCKNPYEKEEITVCLDHSNTSPGYRLGRLFAVLEKIQEEANPKINATIRDRFYGAASTSPVAAFPQLLKLKNHHMAKLENPGRKVNLEKEIGEIFCEVKDFPAHLPMEEQARFSIGYYHQRQSFLRK